MTRVLVTGAQGFVGRYLTALWLEERRDVQILGIGRSPRCDESFTHEVSWAGQTLRAPLPVELATAARDPRYDYQPVDLADGAGLRRLLSRFRPTHVVHLAAALRGDAADHLFRTNVEGSVSLLDAIGDSDTEIERVVLGSSGWIYGRGPESELPRREEARCEPVDLYAVSKLAAENAEAVTARRLSLPVVWARIFNPLGPGQDERHLCGRLASQVASIAKGVTEPVLEIGALAPTRDYVDVRDVARALRLLADRGEAGEVYNVARGIETSVQDVLDATLAAAGLPEQVTLRRLPPRAEDVPRHFADISRLRALGFEVTRTLESSLGDLLDYYTTLVAASADVRREPALRSLSVDVEARHHYDVEIERGLLAALPHRLASLRPGARLVVLTDDRVHELYGAALVEQLRAHGAQADAIVIPEGEASKRFESHQEIIERLYGLDFDRRALLVNLGGGMITDVGGYVAASYLRGVDYVNVPTTLLAQHDSAIGGKVAVNTPWAKNFVGAFHHPSAVYVDPEALRSLRDRDLAAGIAESIKVAILADAELFDRLEQDSDALLEDRDVERLGWVVRRSVQAKIDMLAPDPYENDLRRPLNLGHTFGHALESELGYGEILHGEAVAFGMAFACALSLRHGLASSAFLDRVIALLRRYDLPPTLSRRRIDAARERLGAISLVRANRLHWVLPEEVGRVRIVPEVSDADIDAALDALIAHPVAGSRIES